MSSDRYQSAGDPVERTSNDNSHGIQHESDRFARHQFRQGAHTPISYFRYLVAGPGGSTVTKVCFKSYKFCKIL